MPSSPLPLQRHHASTPQPITSPSPEVTIAPITSPTLCAYRRVITTLLPIPYPPKFYKDSIANPTTSSLALCALWNDAAHPTLASTVVGGIQCRLEPLPTPPLPTGIGPIEQRLYIQTLAILAPYRSLGIATALLDQVVATAITHYSSAKENVVEIYAHVWEANEDALEWYVKRGFLIECAVVAGYYGRLRPSGARIVRRKVGVGDWLRVKEGFVNQNENGNTDAVCKEGLEGRETRSND